MSLLSRSTTSQWTAVAVGLLIFVVYQAIELQSKMQLLETLRRIEKPDTIQYSQYKSSTI